MRKTKAIGVAALALQLSLWTACAQAPVEKRAEEPSLDYLTAATLWYQHAGEARAAAYQAYELARMRLDEILRNNKGGKKKAVVVDVDETVLDNSPFQARSIKKSQPYPAGWSEWVKEAQADPVPGSVEFLKYADSKGVAVFYVTNRKDPLKAATMKNLKKAGFPNVSENSVKTRGKDSSKTPERNQISKEHEIILLVGDNLNDFTDDFEHKSNKARIQSVERMEKKNLWGKRYIVLPNPMYGDWEGALYDYNYGMSDEQKASARRKALRDKE